MPSSLPDVSWAGCGCAAVTSVVPPIPPDGEAPAAPTGLVATPGDAQITFSWTASSGATSYTIKGSTSSGGPFTVIQTGITGTAYTRTGLTNGTTYYHVVTASNAIGESGNSNVVSATPLPPATSKAIYWGRNTAPQLTQASEVTALSFTRQAIEYRGGSKYDDPIPTLAYLFVCWPQAFDGPSTPSGFQISGNPAAMASTGYGSTTLHGYKADVITVSGEPYLVYRLANQTASTPTLIAV